MRQDIIVSIMISIIGEDSRIISDPTITLIYTPSIVLNLSTTRIIWCWRVTSIRPYFWILRVIYHKRQITYRGILCTRFCRICRHSSYFQRANLSRWAIISADLANESNGGTKLLYVGYRFTFLRSCQSHSKTIRIELTNFLPAIYVIDKEPISNSYCLIICSCTWRNSWMIALSIWDTKRIKTTLISRIVWDC